MSHALKSGRWKSCGWRWNELFSPAPFPAAARRGKRDFLCSGMMVSCANSTMDPLRLRRNPGEIPRRISPKSGFEIVLFTQSIQIPQKYGNRIKNHDALPEQMTGYTGQYVRHLRSRTLWGDLTNRKISRWFISMVPGTLGRHLRPADESGRRRILCHH